MGYFLIYQIVPLAALLLIFLGLDGFPCLRFRRWGLPAIFLAGALLQFVLWWRNQPTLENPDSLGFYRLAHGMETDLRAILYRPKLYPWFLAPFRSLRAATFCQCLLKLAMGGLLLRFARLCSWRHSTRALTLFLFLFGSLWLSAPLGIFDTTLFAFLFAAFLVAAAEVATDAGVYRAGYPATKFALMCALAGAATLTRQVGDPALLLVLSLVIARVIARTVAMARRENRRMITGLAGIAFSLLGGLLLASAGAACNGTQHGVYRRSVALGVNIYTHAAYYQLHTAQSQEWDFVETYLPGARAEYPPWETGFRSDMPWTVNGLPHRLERGLGSADAGEILASDRLLRERALAWARGNPAGYLASFANEASRLLAKCEDLYPVSLLDPQARGPVFLRRVERGVIHQPPWLWLAAGMAALGLGWRNRLALLVPGLAALAYLGLVAAVQIGLTRYALPALLPLLMLAGEALDRLPSPFQAARHT